jgi:UDPglucose 6-dehydrogenase
LWKENLLDAKEIIGRTSQIIFYDKLSSTVNDVSAIGILTEWDEFESFDWSKIDNSIKIFDGRNFIKNDRVQKIGRTY